ncbi:hypothetical protein CANARDRAFT_227089 [[Candida] arabinofermentans NRRL YB-2248]|uniref:rRNA methyltransferase 1, mitochondrial n=1 Tax=[Candida] arabinofermentans NRRL YB-2248 TaxID=983967 RepID=A0A1E4STR5_9ASCO|nr:hypothetical protein CANARDRAFT_227089 [[Candida] arabinofermentans NRRL YB-2248]
MPQSIPKKAWELANMDKEQFFKTKHAHHHAAQLKRHGGSLRKRKPVSLDQDEKPQRRDLKSVFKEFKQVSMIEYLHGTNSVLAALKSGKRDEFGRLFIHNPKDTLKLNQIMSLAKKKNLEIIERVSKQDLNLMTKNGVHNGIVLETKPLVPNELKCLSTTTHDKYTIIKDDFGADSLESFPTINGQEGQQGQTKRKYPLALYIDSITDPYNLGAIIRSSYFLGVEFLILSAKNSAPLSPIVSKSSSGALEFMDVWNCSRPLQFFERTQSESNWTIISSISPTTTVKNNIEMLDESELSELLYKSPVLLVIGSEGEGIRTNLIQRSDYTVALKNRGDIDECVDSLNASVATSLLISKIVE